jgi:hypothetical protein
MESYMSLVGGRGEERRGEGIKATLPLPKMAFWKKFLTFKAKKCHFFRKFLGPLKIVTKLPYNFQKIIDTSPLKTFLNPYPPPKIFGQAHV